MRSWSWAPTPPNTRHPSKAEDRYSSAPLRRYQWGMSMQVAVLGAGYVGLVQAGGLTSLGHHVRLGESNPTRVDELRARKVPIYEPGLAELLDRAFDNGLLSVHDSNLDAIDGADVIFLTLPTPPNGDGSADVTIVNEVVAELAPVLTGDQIVVTKSTVPVGTAASIRDYLRSVGCQARVVSNPEFLAEGSAVTDFMRAERIIIGAFEPATADLVADLYVGLPSEVVKTDPASAELVKYAANAYLATRLTFANTIANLSEEVGADALQVLEAMGMDRRIGRHFMRPGPGYGGSCFPKDTRALLAMAAGLGYDYPLLQAVVDTDAYQRTRILERITGMLDGVEDPVVGIWGVAFKARTDDIRESPAVVIARALVERGVRVVMTDPEASIDDVPQLDDPVDCATGADIVVVATEWPEFRRVDFEQVSRAMRGDLIYDVRNLLDPDAVRAAGLRYEGLGRPN
ncbi:MAG: UDP-glucose/GDP-mannose dehydrogenase family protein, partial [Acidimicrobiia bacterium]|nr:UDP-glucose/GDP-mannose dehydrogenase family protein [Acidimicrobiia bacterium]